MIRNFVNTGRVIFYHSSGRFKDNLFKILIFLLVNWDLY